MRALAVLSVFTLLAGCSEPAPASGSASAARSGAAAGVAGAPGELSFELIGTTKLSQLLGDQDKQLKKPTMGQTHAKFGVLGADLGYAFEDGKRTVFLFGDTIGTDGQNGSDAIGFTDDANPEDGVALQFYARPDGKYLPFRPSDEGGKEQRLEGFEVPVAGIRIIGETYIAFKDNHAGDAEGAKDDDLPGAAPPSATDVTKLAKLDGTTGKAQSLCELSRQPDGKFQKIALNHALSDDGLPDGGPWVFMHGTGRHRASHAFLAILPLGSFAACKGSRYWVKLAGGASVWSDKEAEAAAVFTDGGAPEGTMGELSITYAAPIQRWIATYDAKDEHRKVFFRHAREPWGPWSDPIVIFDPKTAGFGAFIHDPSRPADDGQAGPMIGKHKLRPEKARGTVYAPFVVERWTQVEGDTLKLYFVLSTWNPYTVVLMRSDLKMSAGSHAKPEPSVTPP